MRLAQEIPMIVTLVQPVIRMMTVIKATHMTQVDTVVMNAIPVTEHSK
jgi:hypothetical protein